MNASLVIGNETGLTHLGYLSGVPTVCILGGGHFGRFLPWDEFDDVVKCIYNKMDCFQCGWRCKYVNLKKGEIPPCIKNIKPEKVVDAVSIPVVVASGAGDLKHIKDLVNYAMPSGVAISSILHYEKISINDIRTFLLQ